MSSGWKKKPGGSDTDGYPVGGVDGIEDLAGLYGITDQIDLLAPGGQLVVEPLFRPEAQG